MGRECVHCKARSGLWVVWGWRPEIVKVGWGGHEHRYPPSLYARARCLDEQACRARLHKRYERQRERVSRIVLVLPPGDPEARRFKGNCRWCGETMYRPDKPGVVDRRRYYHRAEWGERDCLLEHRQSYSYDARDVVRFVARLAGETELRCVDCSTLCERLDDPRDGTGCSSWEADHELALEDGGEHTAENLKCRCARCHRAKTGRENTARAAARRVRTGA